MVTVLLFFLSIIVFFVGLIKLLVDAIRKKSLKTAAIMISGSFAAFILSIMMVVFSPTTETDKQETTSAESERQEADVSVEKEKKTEEKKAEEKKSEKKRETKSEEKKPEKKEDESEAEEPIVEFSYGNKYVKYLRHEISENSMGEDVLIVYYEFTNNDDDNASFDYSFSDSCFQNGVELDHSMFHANDQTKNSNREIQPGTTVEVASAFDIGDSRDTVTLEVAPWITFSSKKLLTLELELDKN